MLPETSGVGYLVRSLDPGLAVGDQVELFIHTAWSDNNMTLWGFKVKEELELFEMLVKVNGVGPVTAANLVWTVGAGKLVKLIVAERTAEIKAPGVGKKTAQRIVLDLKSKLEQSRLNDELGASSSEASGLQSETVEQASAALQQLGYKQSEIDTFIRAGEFSAEITSEELIKKFLRER